MSQDSVPMPRTCTCTGGARQTGSGEPIATCGAATLVAMERTP
jgi:hypothetical protein